jgi:GT2 family glycosyltransferase
MLYVSIFCYVISKSVEDPSAFVVEEIDRGERAEWPCFRTLARARRAFGEMVVAVDHSSLIAKARSRAAGKFWDSHCDVWLTIDDDIDASEQDLRALVGAVRDGADVVLAPCVLRDGSTINVATDERRVRTTKHGTRLVEVAAGGLALAALSHKAIGKMAEWYSELRWRNPDTNDAGVGLFLEEVRDGRWYGEDISFCRRASLLGLRIEATPDTNVMHAGKVGSIREWLDAGEAVTTIEGRRPAND